MLLLIVVKLEDIDMSKNIRTNVNNEIVKTKNNLKISTNKNIYLKKENVIITFENVGDNRIGQRNNSSLTTKCRSNIGRNYEMAFIEHREGNDWIAIEPVSRCSNDCNKSCSSNQEIDSKDKTSLVWAQTLLQCEKKNSSTSLAPSGSYRISSAAWDKEMLSYVMIHSDIFKISDISKK